MIPALVVIACCICLWVGYHMGFDDGYEDAVAEGKFRRHDAPG